MPASAAAVLGLLCALAGADRDDRAAHHSRNLTAMTDESGSRQRHFDVLACGGKRYTLPDVYEAFSAHALEWNLLGRDNPWWSVLTAGKYNRTAGGDGVPQQAIDEFYMSGRKHVEKVRAL